MKKVEWRSLTNDLLETFPEISEQPVVDNETAFSEQRLHDLLNQALPLLKASSFSVEEQLPVIAALCQGSEYADRIAQLVHLVDDLEFEKAAESARLLLEELPR